MPVATNEKRNTLRQNIRRSSVNYLLIVTILGVCLCYYCNIAIERHVSSNTAAGAFYNNGTRGQWKDFNLQELDHLKFNVIIRNGSDLPFNGMAATIYFSIKLSILRIRYPRADFEIIDIEPNKMKSPNYVIAVGTGISDEKYACFILEVARIAGMAEGRMPYVYRTDDIDIHC